MRWPGGANSWDEFAHSLAFSSSSWSRRLRDAVLLVVTTADAWSLMTNWGWVANKETVITVTIASATFAAVGFRERWPTLGLIAVLPALLLTGLQSAPLILVANYTYRRQVFPALPLLGVTAVLTSLASVLYVHPDSSAILATAQSAAHFAGFVSVGALLGQLAKVRQQQVTQMEELRATQLRERRLTDSKAREDERKRLAREMHDVVSRQVTLIALQAGALQVDRTLPPQVTRTAEIIRSLAAEANGELRELLDALRQDCSTPSRNQHSFDDIHHLWYSSETKGTLTLPALATAELVPPAVQQAVYRICREALTNVHRHADGARVELVVSVGSPESEHLHVSIKNFAAPSPPSPTVTPTSLDHAAVSASQAAGAATLLPGGFGLIGMSEQVAALGGQLSTGVTYDGGFLVVARLPFLPS